MACDEDTRVSVAKVAVPAIKAALEAIQVPNIYNRHSHLTGSRWYQLRVARFPLDWLSLVQAAYGLQTLTHVWRWLRWQYLLSKQR